LTSRHHRARRHRAGRKFFRGFALMARRDIDRQSVWPDNHIMKVNVPIQTIEKLFELLRNYDAATQQFITELSPSDKYEILALIMMVRDNYEDFEEAHDAAKNKIPEQDLTKYFMGRSSDNWQTLQGELQDVIAIKKRYGWEYFELMSGDDTNEDENEDETIRSEE
jgi:hypothetical protein